MKKSNYIKIRSASQHNLDKIDLDIPRDKFTVITGVSGSGKSSLAFDTIYQEAQQRFLSSISGLARNYLGKAQSPQIGSIENLYPTIAVKQNSISGNIRSTVGTVSNIYDYLRLLFARVGTSSEDIITNRSLFSFNTPTGACSACNGLGVLDQIDPEKLIVDSNKTIREGAFEMTTPSGYIVYSQVTMDVLDDVCMAEGFSVDIPWNELSDEQKNIIHFGSDKLKVLFGKHTLESRMKWSGITAKPREEGYYKGIINVMSEILWRDRNKNILRFTKSVTCPTCKGQRLNEMALSVLYHGSNIAELSSKDLVYLRHFLAANPGNEVSTVIIHDVLARLDLMIELGLGYLSLDRSTKSLSGGELQRISLAVQTMGDLQNICYILDEPSMNLHPRQNKVMLDNLYNLKNRGNSLLVVEHNEQFIRNSQHLIELGPLAGVNGGKVEFAGSTAEYFRHERSTENWLNLNDSITAKISSKHRDNIGFIEITAVEHNNLKKIDVKFALHNLNVVTGISGAGKSSLVEGVLAASVRSALGDRYQQIGEHAGIIGLDKLSQLVDIDQKPIGKTIRSNVATYTKLFDLIRKLFAEQPLAKANNWKATHFSFNTKGGRCEACQGVGEIEIGMHLFANISQVCCVCDGKRYDGETLSVKYRDHNIYEVLQLSVTEAAKLFQDRTKIMLILDALISVGLDYIMLGQSSTTFSGGEAQRIKLATYLSKPHKQNSLYILDEPTSGLSIYDVKKLLRALQKLVDQKNTVIAIEHHPNVILAADYVLELGPGSGGYGGEVLYNGAFSQFVDSAESLYMEEISQPYQVAVGNDNAQHEISISGAKTHNLKNVSLRIPHNSFTVITGRSGSGKSSLAYDTIYSEAHNKYLKNLSTYIRSKMGNVAQANVDKIEGLTPVIAISQKGRTKNQRSTIASFTKLSELLKLLFSRVSANQKSKVRLKISDFSTNHHSGACQNCGGLGRKLVADCQKMISHPGKSILSGAMNGSKLGKFYGDPHGQYIATLLQVAEELELDIEKSWSETDAQTQAIIMYGTAGREYNINWQFKRKNNQGEHHFSQIWAGFANLIETEYYMRLGTTRAKPIEQLLKWSVCEKCSGTGFKPEVLEYKILNKNISEYYQLSVHELREYLEQIELSELSDLEQQVYNNLSKKINEILNKLEAIGLGYLELNRSIDSVSGGEYQRLKIISQLFTGLNGITYILDEPTLGLHSDDIANLIKILQQLIEQDNTVIVIEHDREIIQNADYIVELGPKAGKYGGELTFCGSREKLAENTENETGRFINNPPERIISKANNNDGNVIIKQAQANNLKNLNIDLPVNKLIALTGVSGSGKSSLLRDVIYANKDLKNYTNVQEMIGFEQFDDILYVDQNKLPQSSVGSLATYTKIFDSVRKLFASTDVAKKRKYTASEFSYLNKKTQCPECAGMGQKRISMDFMGDLWLDCELCNGERYIPEILEISYKGKNISQILKMELVELQKLLQGQKKILDKLDILVEVGLGYLQFGQSLSTLSGGENQRLKLALGLFAGKNNSKNLYLLDEPSSGLHISDINQLLRLFEKLRDAGNTIIFIEHNADMIINADKVIELGPVGGNKGGYLV